MEELLNPKKENDFENITERLEYDHIAYMYIEDDINFPLFQKGDMVSILRKDWYDEKEIILYYLEGHYFLRRIIKKSDKSYFLCADNEREIRFIDESCILGKVISRERGKKRLSLVLGKNKFYTNSMMRKGKFLLISDTITDDHEDQGDVFKYAESASFTSSINRKSKLNLNEEAPIDDKLMRDIEQFKSPYERMAEYEEHLSRTQVKNKIQEEPSEEN